MVRENLLTAAGPDLAIVHHRRGAAQEEPIASLPGVARWSVDGIVARAAEAIDLGIPCVALFPNTPPALRSDDGAEAANPDNLMCRAIRAIKEAHGDAIGVLTDVALDPYTSHGQDGIIDDQGYVLNDETVAALWSTRPVNQARAGADIIAPSDMMDGRIGSIRRALEMDGHVNVQIMSYAAKYASAFYGPVPRCGRLTRAAEGRQEKLPDGSGQWRRSLA